MATDTGTTQYQHQWIYVIIPVQEAYDSVAYRIPATKPLFSAWCKQPGCSAYFTQALEFSTDFARSAEGKVDLPQFGCVPPNHF